jgi:hypothetical protein
LNAIAAWSNVGIFLIAAFFIAALFIAALLTTFAPPNIYFGIAAYSCLFD